MHTSDTPTALLQTHYAIQAQLSKLDGDRDDNYLATSTSGEKFVLKLMHPDCDANTVDLQCKAMQNLTHLPLDVPQVIPSRHSSLYTQVEVAGEQRILWLLKWCDGVLLGDLAHHGVALQNSFGAALAQLDIALQNVEHAATSSHNQWNLTAASLSIPFLDSIEGPLRQQARASLEHFSEHTLPALSTLPHGLIHNDANDYNVLVSGVDDKARVSGFIDFGDMNWQPIICDVAIALAYLIPGKPDPLEVCGNFLKGYHALRPIGPAELDVLYDLMRTRLSVSIAISSHRQITEPNDPYITISQQPAKQALNRLSQIPRDTAKQYFHQTCS